jgi:hypothetical protein
MTCPHCGGSMLGDGVTTVIHCERLSVLDLWREPDSAPVHCESNPDWHPARHDAAPRNPLYGDTLTPDQLAAGWHYCPAFDGLLTQGEGDNGTCFCNPQQEDDQ